MKVRHFIFSGYLSILALMQLQGQIQPFSTGGSGVYDDGRQLGEYMSEFGHFKRTTEGMPLLEYEDIDGNPYLNNDFIKGQIVMNDERVFLGPLRLNNYTKKIEMLSEDGEAYTISDPQGISYIRIEDMTFVYVPDPHKKSSFISMELLYSGTSSVYLRRSVDFKDAAPKQAYQEPLPPRFVDNDDELFILHPDKGYVEIRSRKNLLKLFSDKEDALKSFMKEEKLDPTKPADLISILEFYYE